MGYSPGISNLLSAPPVIAAVPSSLFFAYLSDKYRLRAPFIAPQSIICLVGLMLTVYTHRNSTSYLGIFLGIMGCQGNIPAVLAYQSNNIRLQSKRAVGTALQIGFGSLGGIIASTVFRAQDAPGYLPGLWVTAALQLGLLFGLAIMSCWFCGINQGVDGGTEMAEGLVGFKYTL
jgi:sugar phosphate permease